jgi:hypothetical protein
LILAYLNQPKYATFWLHATHIWGYCFLVSSPADAAFKLEVAKQPLKLLPSASMIRIDKGRQNDASNLESDDTDILSCRGVHILRDTKLEFWWQSYTEAQQFPATYASAVLSRMRGEIKWGMIAAAYQFGRAVCLEHDHNIDALDAGGGCGRNPCRRPPGYLQRRPSPYPLHMA